MTITKTTILVMCASLLLAFLSGAHGACSNGVVSEEGTICCSSECSSCGGILCKEFYPSGGRDGRTNCCQGSIFASEVYCGLDGGDPPCILDVGDDTTESDDDDSTDIDGSADSEYDDSTDAGDDGQIETCTGLGIEGIADGNSCCPWACGQCGGSGCGAQDSGSNEFSGSEACCSSGVPELDRSCSEFAPPCTISGAGTTGGGHDSNDSDDDDSADSKCDDSTDSGGDDSTDSDDADSTDSDYDDMTDSGGDDSTYSDDDDLILTLTSSGSSTAGGGHDSTDSDYDGSTDSDYNDMTETDNDDSTDAGDAGMCSDGVMSEDGTICCSNDCSACGGILCKEFYPGGGRAGRANCCTRAISRSEVYCGVNGGEPPCIR